MNIPLCRRSTLSVQIETDGKVGVEGDVRRYLNCKVGVTY